MKSCYKILYLAMMATSSVLLSCRNDEMECPLLGRWWVETYYRWDNDSLGGVFYADTIYYDMAEGVHYEVLFRADATGSVFERGGNLFIKEAPFRYEYDEPIRQLTLSTTWFVGVMLPMNERLCFDVEYLDDSLMVASWVNSVAEPSPFNERFVMSKLK